MENWDGAMTVSSEIHGVCIYILPCSRKNQKQPSKYKVTPNTREHTLKQEKEKAKEEKEKRKVCSVEQG